MCAPNVPRDLPPGLLRYKHHTPTRRVFRDELPQREEEEDLWF